MSKKEEYDLKISLSQSGLSSALAISMHTLPTRSTLPVLENVKLIIDSIRSKITIVSTDLDSMSKISIPVAIFPGNINDSPEATPPLPSKPIEILLPGKQFKDYVKALPVAQMELLVNILSGVTIKSGKTSFKLPVVNILEEYPEIKNPEGVGFAVPVELFNLLINQTDYAANPKETRLFASVIAFNVEIDEPAKNTGNGWSGKLTATATDINCIAKRVIPVDNVSANGVKKVFIPVQFAQKIAGIVGAMDGTVSLMINDKHLYVSSNDQSIVAGIRLLDCSYPKMQQFFDTEFPAKVVFNRVEMIKSLKRAELVEKRGHIYEGGEGLIESISIDCVGELSNNQFHDEVSIAKRSGEKRLDFRVTISYFLQFLEAANSTEIELNFGGRDGNPVNNGKLMMLQGNGENYQYILLPLGEAKKEAAA